MTGWLPRPGDVLVAGLVAAMSVVALAVHADSAGVTPTALGWVSIFVLAAPLIWRRRAPVVVFWVTAALVVASSLAGADSPAPLFASLAAVYGIARHARAGTCGRSSPASR